MSSDPEEIIAIPREELEIMVRGLLSCTTVAEVHETADWIMRRHLKVKSLEDRDRDDS